MSFCHVHFCTNDYPYYSCGFLSCTCLYKWLSISLCMGFRHAHFCTNDYSFLSNVFSSCTCFYEWLSISLCLYFCHAHFCTNDCHFFLNGFSSCTFLYEWLPFLFEWIFVMHVSVFRVCNALQRMSMVQWQIINYIIMYIGFDHVLNVLHCLNSEMQLNGLRTM